MVDAVWLFCRLLVLPLLVAVLPLVAVRVLRGSLSRSVGWSSSALLSCPLLGLGATGAATRIAIQSLLANAPAGSDRCVGAAVFFLIGLVGTIAALVQCFGLSLAARRYAYTQLVSAQPISRAA